MELGGMKGLRQKDITYGNVCGKSLRNTETCWNAKDPVRHGHAPVGKKRSQKKLIKKQQHYWHGNMPGSWISQSRRKETRIRFWGHHDWWRIWGGRHIYIQIRHKVLKSSKVVMGTNLRRCFLIYWGSDYGVNTVRVSGSCVEGNDTVRGWVSDRISSRIRIEGRST